MPVIAKCAGSRYKGSVHLHRSLLLRPKVSQHHLAIDPRRPRQSQIRPMTAPDGIRWPPPPLRPHRIQVNRPPQLTQTSVLLAQDRLVPPWKHRPPRSMVPIPILSLARQPSLPDPAERIALPLRQPMPVVGHQHVGIEREGMFLFFSFQPPEARPVIRLGLEHGRAVMASGDNVVERAFAFDARWSGPGFLLRAGAFTPSQLVT